MAEITELLRKLGGDKLPDMSGMAMGARLGKVRIDWRDGSHSDFTKKVSHAIAEALETCVNAPRGVTIPKVFFPGSATALTVELIRDGDYHGEKTDLVRIHWGRSGQWLDLHPTMARAYASGLRHYAAR